MAGANQTLWPVIAPALGTAGLGEAWQACTTLREHRGDGHTAALLVHGIGGLEAHLLAAGTKAIPAELLRESRGWSEGQWKAGTERLAARGILHEDGRATDAGRTLHGEVEDLTDRLAEPAYAAFERRRARVISMAPCRRAPPTSRRPGCCRSPTRWDCRAPGSV